MIQIFNITPVSSFPLHPKDIDAVRFYITSDSKVETENLTILINDYKPAYTFKRINSTTVLYTVPVSLEYMTHYLLKVLATNNADETKKILHQFFTIQGVQIQENFEEIYTRAYVTQFIANGLPAEAYGRDAEYSIFQQLINPAGLRLHELQKDCIIEGRNHFFQLANMGEMGLVYTYDLQPGESFSESLTQSGDPVFTRPSLVAREDVNKINVNLAYRNSLYGMDIYSIPTRIHGTKIASVVSSLITEIGVDDCPLEEEHDIATPTHLYVTVTEGQQYVKLEGNKTETFSVCIHGEDRYGINISDTLVFIRDSVVKSTKEFRKITKVEAFGRFNYNALIRIELAPPSEFGYLDPVLSMTTKYDDEKMIKWKLSESNGNSFLSADGLSDGDIGMVITYNMSDETHYKYELLGYMNEPILLNDIAPDPVNDWIFAVDNTHLYIYDKKESYPTGLKDIKQTKDSPFSIFIYPPQQNVARDDEVHISIIRHTLGTPVLSYQFTIKFPDGSTVNFDRVSSADPGALSFMPKGFIHQFNQNGEFIITLTTYHINNVTKITQRLVYVEGRRPLAKYDISHIIPNMASAKIYFDSDYKLNILVSGSLYKLDFKRDYMLVDYEDRIIYLLENYDGVWMS